MCSDGAVSSYIVIRERFFAWIGELAIAVAEKNTSASFLASAMYTGSQAICGSGGML